MAEPEPNPAPSTVLLVDDDPVMLEVAGKMLVRGGYEVIAAGDGEEALAQMAAHQDEIACVVLDWTMPRMTGEEVLATWRALGFEVPILIVTGNQLPELLRLLDVGSGIGFLEKPFRMTELLDSVAELVVD